MDRGIRIKGQVCLSQVREVVLWTGQGEGIADG